MAPDSRIEAYTIDDVLCIEAFHLGIGVELIEIADSQGEICIGEKFHGLGLGKAHVEGVDVLLDGPFLKQCGECPCGLIQLCPVRGNLFGRYAEDDAGRVEIVVEGLALAEELRSEKQSELPAVAVVEAFAIAYRNGALYDNDGLRIDFPDQVDDFLHVGGVEVVPYRVVVGRGGHDHEIRISVCPGSVQCGREVQVFLRKIFLNVLVLDR